MSHELRTPLNAILGFAEMIRDDVYGDVPEAMREPVADIQTCGRQLLGLINDVLDRSKIEAGRMELALGDYSVDDIVNTVRFSLRSLAAEKGLELSAQVEADLPFGYGDGKRITQCLMNLAGNALKFTKAGRVEVAAEREGDWFRFAVADTGIGIPAPQLETIFEEFRQVDATVTREFGAPGSACPSRRSSWSCTAAGSGSRASREKGSTFSFTVPIRVAEGAGA
jgi:signal transduction histidine kinase